MSRVEKEFTFADVTSTCDRLSVKMASENSSEDEFETLHYLVEFTEFCPCQAINSNPYPCSFSAVIR